MGGDLQERISIRAYRIWEEEGRPDGSADAHWHQARNEIEEEDKANGKAAPAAKPKATRPRKAAAADKPKPATTRTRTPRKKA